MSRRAAIAGAPTPEATRRARPRAGEGYRLGPSERARLAALGALLDRLAKCRVELDWAAVDRSVEELARRLRQTLTPADLAAARVLAVPRGGHLVLGLLAYHLGLERSHLEPGDGIGEEGGCRDGDVPTVLVDDCALTGLRLSQAVTRQRQTGAGRLVVAHLCSPPELRRRVLEREPAVEACVAAFDLDDQAAAVFPDRSRREAWRRRWRRRLGGETRYWIGLAPPLAFPWGEPDHPVWNPATGRLEAGWRFLPPHRSPKARSALLASLPAACRDVPADDRRGRLWRGREGVVWSVSGGTVWLCRAGDRRVFSLDGSAALVWKALVCGHGEGGASAALEAAYDVSLGTARHDAAALAAELAGRDLLETDPRPNPAGTLLEWESEQEGRRRHG